MEITLSKKTNTIYGFAWDIATTISHLDGQEAVWAELFGDLSVFDIDGILNGQAAVEGLKTSEVYYARRPGNSGPFPIQKHRGIRFSTKQLIALGDRAGLNLSKFISN